MCVCVRVCVCMYVCARVCVRTCVGVCVGVVYVRASVRCVRCLGVTVHRRRSPPVTSSTFVRPAAKASVTSDNVIIACLR